MELAQATICHIAEGRVRLRICGRKGDRAYLTGVADELRAYAPEARVEATSLTGSILILGPEVDIVDLTAFAEQKRLFRLSKSVQGPPLLDRLEAPAIGMNRWVHRISDGRLDLLSAAILALISMGVIGFVRGHRSMPPWYTTFWYAFSILSLAKVGKRSG